MGNHWGRLFIGLADTFQTTIVIVDSYYVTNPRQNTKVFSRGQYSRIFDSVSPAEMSGMWHDTEDFCEQANFAPSAILSSTHEKTRIYLYRLLQARKVRRNTRQFKF